MEDCTGGCERLSRVGIHGYRRSNSTLFHPCLEDVLRFITVFVQHTWEFMGTGGRGVNSCSSAGHFCKHYLHAHSICFSFQRFEHYLYIFHTLPLTFVYGVLPFPFQLDYLMTSTNLIIIPYSVHRLNPSLISGSISCCKTVSRESIIPRIHRPALFCATLPLRRSQKFLSLWPAPFTSATRTGKHCSQVYSSLS